MTVQLLDQLNPQQREAVTTTEGPLLIIAGAGSGKTRVITYRITHLVRECGVMPGRILASTFTNKAAEEMRERVRRLLSAGRDMPFAVSTFHAWCARVLRREAEKIGIARDFTICDDDDQLSIIKEVFRGKGLDLKKGPVLPAQARWAIDQAKMKLQSPDDLREGSRSEYDALYADIYTVYQRLLRQNNALDFGDLLAEVVHLFESDGETLESYQEQYRYLMVDEYQDTNHVQYRLVKALAAKYRNVCVVGDEDQSIYSWRGADLGNLLDFRKEFPEAKLIRLEQNYRSTQNILDAAGEVIAYNKERLGKELWTDRGAGAPLLLFEARDDRDEAFQIAQLAEWFHDECFVPYSEIAVFYRTNALSRLIEERLRAAGISYRVIGGVRFYDRREIKDLLAYLRVVANPYDSLAFARIINTPRRGIGAKTLQRIIDRAFRDDRSLFETIETMRGEKAFKKAADLAISEFVEMLQDWAEYAQSHTIADLLTLVLKDTRYVESLGDPEAIDVISRRENIDELQNAIAQYEREWSGATLRDFLEYTSLRAGADEYEPDEESVSLMTVHCAKGLEFRVVFVIALEKGIFPHALALKEGAIEEERRLMYVAITRAKDVLCLSCAGSRFAQGEQKWNPPSPFLREIPNEMLHLPNRTRLAQVRAALAGGSADLESPRPKKALGGRRRTATKPLAAEPRNTGWSVGQAIVHPSLGRGEITAVRGSGEGEMLMVEFEDGLRMEFLAHFARLRRERT